MTFRERAYVLTGERHGRIWLLRRHCVQIGEPHCVEMNWGWALLREEARGDVLGFGHTHPPRGGVTPSLRDVRTMQAWCLAFGKPLLCVIECDGCAQSTLFCDEEDAGRALPLTQIFARGALVAVEGDDNDNESA